MTSPIGVFDSGLGGLSVAGVLLRRLPNERIVYFADTAHVPYGERPLEEIQQFALGITEFLIGRGAKTVVMACNMSSAVALDAARKAFPDIPILGTIDAGSRAAVAGGEGAIGVLATTGTVKSGAYTRTIHGLDADAKVWEQACPKFVPLVESGMTHTEEAEAAVREYVEPLLHKGARSLVLGCTHYPFLRHVISSVAPEARIIDPAEETVSELEALLGKNRKLAVEAPQSDHEFYTSGETESFREMGSTLLGSEIEQVNKAVWGVDLQVYQPQLVQR